MMRNSPERHRLRTSCGLIVLAALGLASLKPAVLHAQGGSSEGSLDDVVRLSLRDVTLGDLPAEIERQTGVRLRITDRALDLAPNGPATLITRADIFDVPLRDGLAELLGGLLLALRETPTGADVVPSPLLARVGRRPTWEQVDLLVGMDTLQPGVESADLDRLRAMLQFRVPDDNPWEALAAEIHRIGAGTGANVLSLAAERLGWSWIVDDAAIVILPRREAVGRALDVRVSLIAKNQPLSAVLGAIGAQAGVEIRIEERALAALPLGVQRRFSITLRNKRLGEVLDSIGSYTSLAPVLTADGIVLVRAEDRRWFERAQVDPALEPGDRPAGQGSDPQSADDGRPIQRKTAVADSPERTSDSGAAVDVDPVVARITVIDEDGRRVEWLVRWSELPPDLRARRSADLQSVFDEVRRRLPAENASEKTPPD